MSEEEYTDKNGVTYVAEPGDNPCGRCAHMKHSLNCAASPSCVWISRKDAQNIAWVVKK